MMTVRTAFTEHMMPIMHLLHPFLTNAAQATAGKSFFLSSVEEEELHRAQGNLPHV